jgi:molecular chaperone GrpE
MSDTASSPTNSPAEPERAQTVKVTDKRRVSVEGEPTEAAHAEAALPEEGSPEVIAKLEADLEAARRRVDELARAYQAVEKDKEAFKQRLTREREQLADIERGNVAMALLEAIDELDLCLSAGDTSPLATGVKLVRDNLVKKAESTGIERVELLGTSYDPNLAEATGMDITGRADEDGKVVEMPRACYRMKGRVIRPGRVKVLKYVKPAEA